MEEPPVINSVLLRRSDSPIPPHPTPLHPPLLFLYYFCSPKQKAPLLSRWAAGVGGGVAMLMESSPSPTTPHQDPWETHSDMQPPRPPPPLPPSVITFLPSSGSPLIRPPPHPPPSSHCPLTSTTQHRQVVLCHPSVVIALCLLICFLWLRPPCDASPL